MPRRRSDIWRAYALAAALPLAVIPFGTVGSDVRLVVSAIILASVPVITWRAKRPERSTRLVIWGLIAVLLLSALPLIPAGSGMRAVLQPGLAPIIDRSLAIAGTSVHPLAVNPRGAVEALALASAALMLLMGTALMLRSGRYLRRISRVVVGTGVALSLLALLQLLSHAESIYWISGIPATVHQPFYGSFINTNHAGILLAVALPLAIAGGTSQIAMRQVSGVICSVLLAVGVWFSHSRGAALEACVGVGVMLSLWGSPLLTRVTLSLGAVAGAAAAVIGPRRIGNGFTYVLEGRYHTHDVFGERGQLYADTAELIAGAPLLGIGGGGFKEAFRPYREGSLFASITHAHNDWLQLMAEHGVVVSLGLVALLVVILVLGIRACRRLPAMSADRKSLGAVVGALIALATAASFDFPMHIGALVIMGALLLGVLLASQRWITEASRERRPVAGRAARVMVALGGLAALACAFAMPKVDGRVREATAQRAQPEASLQVFREALASRPLHHRAMMGMASAYVASNEPKKAIEVLELASETYPTLPWIWLNIARLQRAEGNGEQALGAYRTLLELNLSQTDVRAGEYMVEAYDATGKTMQSPLVFVEYVLPERAERRCEGADLLAVRGFPELAEQVFREAIPRARFPVCAASLATWLNSWGRPHEALETLTALESPTCWSKRTEAAAHYQLENWDGAIGCYRDALDLCGASHVDVRIGLAYAYVEKDEPHGYVILGDVIQAEPDRHDVRRALIVRHERLEQFAEVRYHLNYLSEKGAASSAERARLLELGVDRGQLLPGGE